MPTTAKESRKAPSCWIASCSAALPDTNCRHSKLNGSELVRDWFATGSELKARHCSLLAPHRKHIEFFLLLCCLPLKIQACSQNLRTHYLLQALAKKLRLLMPWLLFFSRTLISETPLTLAEADNSLRPSKSNPASKNTAWKALPFGSHHRHEGTTAWKARPPGRHDRLEGTTAWKAMASSRQKQAQPLRHLALAQKTCEDSTFSLLAHCTTKEGLYKLPAHPPLHRKSSSSDPVI